VLTLILVLLLLWFVLGVLLAAWTLWFQGYIYSEPAPGVWWRAAAAGTALTVAVCLWVVLDYRAPGRYRTLFEFSGQEEQKPYPELRIRRDGREEVYLLRKDERGRPEYRRDKDNRLLPARPDKIIAVEGGQQHVYLPERDAKGNFKVETGQSLRYYEEGNPGQYMVEGGGRVASYRFGRLVLDLFLNALHFVVWWAVLWLLLRFQWSHALGLAIAFWAAMTLFVLPPLLTRAEEVARQRAAAQAAAGADRWRHSSAQRRHASAQRRHGPVSYFSHSRPHASPTSAQAAQTSGANCEPRLRKAAASQQSSAQSRPRRAQSAM
jgi:hypothetical protein